MQPDFPYYSFRRAFLTQMGRQDSPFRVSRELENFIRQEYQAFQDAAERAHNFTREGPLNIEIELNSEGLKHE